MKILALFILCSGTLLFAQGKPPAYSLIDPVAGEPLHAVWTTKVPSLGSLQTKINSVLATMGWKVLHSGPGEPPFSTLSLAAVIYPTSDPTQRLGLFLDVDMERGNATITTDWYRVVPSDRPKAQAKLFYDEFFLRLAEALK